MRRALCGSLLVHLVIFLLWPQSAGHIRGGATTLSLTLRSLPSAPPARSATAPQTAAHPSTQKHQTPAGTATEQPTPSASKAGQHSQQQTPALQWSLPTPHKWSPPPPTPVPDSDIFDPRLRRALQHVRDQPPGAKSATNVIQRRPLPGANRSFIRVGDHCFIHEEADALDEDDFQRWSPQDC